MVTLDIGSGQRDDREQRRGPEVDVGLQIVPVDSELPDIEQGRLEDSIRWGPGGRGSVPDLIRREIPLAQASGVYESPLATRYAPQGQEIYTVKRVKRKPTVLLPGKRAEIPRLYTQQVQA